MTDSGSGKRPAVWQVVLGGIVVVIFIIGLFAVIDRVFSWGFFLLIIVGFGAWWFFVRRK
jgi:hypothetical protein